MNSATHSIEDLKGPDNDRCQTIDFVAQRIAWITMVLTLVAAVLGLFGQGLLSERHLMAEDQSLYIAYQAIDRYEAPTTLRLSVPAASRSEKQLKLHFSKRFADSVTAESISPEPLVSSLKGEHIVYEFAVQEVADAEIVFRHKHDEPGWLTYDVAVEGHAPVSIQQYILP